MINMGRLGLLSQEQKKTFEQKLGTIVNNRNIKQFRNKSNLLVKHYSCKLGTILLFWLLKGTLPCKIGTI